MITEIILAQVAPLIACCIFNDNHPRLHVLQHDRPPFENRAFINGDAGTHKGVRAAAADWSLWPAGTVFRLLSTGQSYRVEDYCRTIDLYMPNQREMNSWGAREETIEILQWGDPQESLQFLRRHQDYRHIKRMVLELEGHEKEAASLR